MADHDHSHNESIEAPGSFLTQIVYEIINSPLNLALIGVITLLIYKIVKSKTERRPIVQAEPELPKLRRDFTVEELKPYDGTQEDGRVLVAVNGNVYDVTKGKRFDGPGGPYSAFGGRDASRGLATFSVTATEELKYDDLSDLSPMEMESVREWEMQFKEKYDIVGKLLKPGEAHTSYSDEEEDPNTTTTSTPTATVDKADEEVKSDAVDTNKVETEEKKEEPTAAPADEPKEAELKKAE